MKSLLRIAATLILCIFQTVLLNSCGNDKGGGPDNGGNGGGDARVYVNANAPGPLHDGESWATAFLTVQEGIDEAFSGEPMVASEEVWVAAGTYVGGIKLMTGVDLYGGFAGTETAREQRAPAVNVTTLDGNQQGTVVWTSTLDNATTIDGFVICNGEGADTVTVGGCGILCDYATPSGHITISNNTIRANSGVLGGGITMWSSRATVRDNLIEGNTPGRHGEGGGIFCHNSFATISGNHIRQNDAGGAGGIAGYTMRGSIYNNVIEANIGAGIRCNSWSDIEIFGNLIIDNTYVGIIVYDSSPRICSNTICRNGDEKHDAGIAIGGYIPTVVNNIIALNHTGIYVWNGTPILGNNCVFGSVSADYDGTPPGSGDISLDPEFVSSTTGDFHLMPSSPCIDAGDDGVVESSWVDMDGQERIYGSHVDIGADEFHPRLTHQAN